MTTLMNQVFDQYCQPVWSVNLQAALGTNHKVLLFSKFLNFYTRLQTIKLPWG